MIIASLWAVQAADNVERQSKQHLRDLLAMIRSPYHFNRFQRHLVAVNVIYLLSTYFRLHCLRSVHVHSDKVGLLTANGFLSSWIYICALYCISLEVPNVPSPLLVHYRLFCIVSNDRIAKVYRYFFLFLRKQLQDKRQVNRVIKYSSLLYHLAKIIKIIVRLRVKSGFKYRRGKKTDPCF